MLGRMKKCLIKCRCFNETNNSCLFIQSSKFDEVKYKSFGYLHVYVPIYFTLAIQQKKTFIICHKSTEESTGKFSIF